ncbi:MAG: hypothetical protein ACREHG_07855 [Candidatus Saccharimonadales bacterium]
MKILQLTRIEKEGVYDIIMHLTLLSVCVLKQQIGDLEMVERLVRWVSSGWIIDTNEVVILKPQIGGSEMVSDG